MSEPIIATDANIGSLVKESIDLAESIKQQSARRQAIAAALEDYMLRNDRNVIVTEHNQTVQVRPKMVPSYQRLHPSIKKNLVDWLYGNYPETLTVKVESLINLIANPEIDVPFDIDISGVAIRLLDRVVEAPAVRLDTMRELRSYRANKKHKAQIKTVSTPVVKVSGRLQKIERKAHIIEEWLSGTPKSHIAKKYGLSAPYVGEIIKQYERQAIRDIRFALRDSTKKD